MRRHAWLVLALLAGVSVRLMIALAFPRMPLVSDELEYVEAADALLKGEQHPWLLFHPPLYTAFCAAVRWVAPFLSPGEHSRDSIECALSVAPLVAHFATCDRSETYSEAHTFELPRPMKRVCALFSMDR